MLLRVLIILVLTFGEIKGGDDDQRNARSNKCLKKRIQRCDIIEQEYFDYGVENCRNCLYCKEELTEKERYMTKEEFYVRSFNETSCLYYCKDYLLNCVIKLKPRDKAKEIDMGFWISLAITAETIIILVILVILWINMKMHNKSIYIETVKKPQKSQESIETKEEKERLQPTTSGEAQITTQDDNIQPSTSGLPLHEEQRTPIIGTLPQSMLSVYYSDTESENSLI